MTLSTVESLLAIEEIKRLKSRYFRLLDEHSWTDWSSVFTEAATMTLVGDPPTVLQGRDTILKAAQQRLHHKAGMHFGHMPDIRLDSSRAATGRWRLLAYSREDGDHAQADVPPGTISFGTYYDNYVLEPDSRWRILSTTVETVFTVPSR